ncbi:acetate/propionate family kinase [Calothrix sp. CCY 0018]|uniref:acetate/propionate family kinase n=1 Tax=Calothrix sp. CCY 0018 TaxID=3103864 RepID=UPI0039C7502F
MNVLVFNAGSASLKFELIRADSEKPDLQQLHQVISCSIEHIGGDAVLSQLQDKKVIHKQQITANDYSTATQQALKWLNKQEISNKFNKFDVVGHRIVHGANRFTAPILINDEVIAEIEALEELAPLHNANAVDVIRATHKLLGNKVPMVAVFDTVFHRDIPDFAHLYGIPFELSERYQIRRYGFHGISHQYMATRYAQITNTPKEKVDIITLHLESGCSATAIKAGKSIDTSMGFTPLEGLMMGKRSGDIDPALINYLATKEGVEVGEIEELLNNKSGLLGVSGISHDTRVLMKHFDTDKRVRLAMEVFCYRILKYIGAYLAVLGGAKAIVFGGGIGENTLFVRDRICSQLKWCGLMLDSERNQQTIDCEGKITSDDSGLHAYVIPVQEGLQIAQQAVLTIF